MKKIKWIILSIGILLLAACALSRPEAEIVSQPDEEIDVNQISYEIEEYAAGLEVPWGMAFTSPTRVLVTERPGRLRVIENEVLSPEPLHVFEEVSSTGEEGLMSVELDLDYENNKWIYFSMAYQKNQEMKVKVVRFEDDGDSLTEETIIIDNLPAARFHAGSRLAFGPDGKLYITVGDALNRKDAQDLNSLAGKLLRINKDGSIPDDNPFEGSPIWSYGHRNPQGIDWHPETRELYSSEHGPSVFDGPPGGDEVNRIVEGGNYGWPLVSHEKTLEGTISPIIQYTPAEPPASLLIYSGKAFPKFQNNIFIGSLKGEGLLRIVLDKNDPDKIIAHEKLFEGEYGRIRTVIEGPNGSIYFSTSNQDGRGNPNKRDDRIMRIKPI
jgi:glucose/arabinose dehydrogenase